MCPVLPSLVEQHFNGGLGNAALFSSVLPRPVIFIQDHFELNILFLNIELFSVLGLSIQCAAARVILPARVSSSYIKEFHISGSVLLTNRCVISR